MIIPGSCRQQRENKCSFVHEKSDVEYCSNKIAVSSTESRVNRANPVE